MTIEKSVTEIADSEEEPMTSSPVDVSGEAARVKLSALASVPSQERQDALPEADVNITSHHAERLDPDPNDASVDVHASNIDQTDPKLDDRTTARQEGANPEACNNDQDAQIQKHSPQEDLRVDDMPVEDIQAPPTNAVISTQVTNTKDCNFKHEDTRHAMDDGDVDPGEPEAADEGPQDTTNDPATSCEVQQPTPEVPPDAGSTTEVNEEQAVIDSKPVEQQETQASTGVPNAARGVSADPKVDSHLPTGILSPAEDIVMGNDSPQMQAVDDGPTPVRGTDVDHPSEHAVCSRPTYSSRPFAYIEQISASKLIAATSSVSAESEGVIIHTDTSDAAEQTAASVPIAQGDSHPDAETIRAKDAPDATQDIDMHVDGHSTTARSGDPTPSSGEASTSVTQDEHVPANCGETRSAMAKTSLMKETEHLDAAAIPRPDEPTSPPHSDPSAQPSSLSVRPAPPMTPQEITLAELRAEKAALLASLGDLPAIQVLMEESASSDVNMEDGDGEPTETDIMAAANKIVKEHIKLLHEYNELKDVGQGLMGLIADQRGVRIVEVQEEFGIDAKD
jgi:hypothetical protein